MTTGTIKKNISTDHIPNKAGVYKYYDKNGNLLYVGKAKRLKQRISSYFNKIHKEKKTNILVCQIFNIEYVLVDTEMDALLLENNLIKKHKPKYNVLLKDDKTYPWICISKEKIPRVYQTRTVKKKGGSYFGPYQSSKITRMLLSFFSDLFYANGWTPLTYLNRTIKNEEERRNYLNVVEDIKKILGGKVNGVVAELKKRMLEASKNLEFEKAQVIKEQIALLKGYQSKSTIVSPKINNIDVFSIVTDKLYAFVNYLKISSGSIVASYNMKITKKLDEPEKELLLMAIFEIRKKFNSSAKTIYCSHKLNVDNQIKFIVPKIGDKKKLINLSLRNAKQMQIEAKSLLTNSQYRQNNKKILRQLKLDLGLSQIPSHIECFDISNLQGTNSVGACVVFKNAKPAKKEYRHFNIKSVEGPNDFASIEEVVYRRYKKLIISKRELPQLIVIDGGIGQLNSARKSLKKLNIHNKVDIIGIAKKLEEVFQPNDKTPLYLNKRSESLKLLQRLRNEAHRFSLKQHRNKRSNNLFTTSLDGINGIGAKTIDLLLSNFGSIEKIKKTKKEKLASLIGEDKATKIIKGLYPKK